MFIVLQNGIYCFPTSLTNVTTKVMALSAWPRTWLTPVRVHVPTKILKWILVRAVWGAAVRVVGDGVRGGGSRWWWTSDWPWQWQPPVVSMVVRIPYTRLHVCWQVFDDLSTHVAPTITFIERNRDSEKVEEIYFKSGRTYCIWW